MIKLLRQLSPIQGVRSVRDARKLVDSYPAIYACPPGGEHPNEHEWGILFEVPRGRKFTAPKSFLDKEEAVQFLERTL